MVQYRSLSSPSIQIGAPAPQACIAFFDLYEDLYVSSLLAVESIWNNCRSGGARMPISAIFPEFYAEIDMESPYVLRISIALSGAELTP